MLFLLKKNHAFARYGSLILKYCISCIKHEIIIYQIPKPYYAYTEITPFNTLIYLFVVLWINLGQANHHIALRLVAMYYYGQPKSNGCEVVTTLEVDRE